MISWQPYLAAAVLVGGIMNGGPITAAADAPSSATGRSSASEAAAVVAALPDIHDTPADLVVPPLTDGSPAPGSRVKQFLPEYKNTELYHLLYLPTDWKEGGRYPVIVEYAGNGNFKNDYGDVSTGRVEGSNLGYGISAGQGFLWLCLPFVDAKLKKPATHWWGDLNATVDYCKKAVRSACEEFGGDPSAVILTGFSRGAIGCGYIGLHDDLIADLWLAFIPYSHYDGVTPWGYPKSDPASAIERMKRLRGRASFVCQEVSVDKSRRFINASNVNSPFTFLDLPFRNHNDAWVLRDLPARATLRSWLQEVLKTRPGTHVIKGSATDATCQPVEGVRIESGSRWAITDANGCYRLAGIPDGKRKISATKEGWKFTPAERGVEVAGKDLEDITFTVVK